MQEYVDTAVILKKDPLGDLDGRYTFFTERFGKVMAKTKSSRKITSKLAPHLEPGNVVRVRFIEKNGTQIIDALKASRLALALLDLHFLNQLLPEAQPEPSLWELLLGKSFSWIETLALLGWDPDSAECATCGVQNPKHFYVPRQEFFCTAHASKMPRDGVLSLVDAKI